MKILEVINTWPAETFIQRHVQAMHIIGFPVLLVARYRTENTDELASLDKADSNLPLKIIPNFNHLNPIEKTLSLRYLSVKSLSLSSALGISQKVLFGYFERLEPDLIHFHTATLAAMMSWIPQALGIPYTLSLRGSDVQVIPLQSPQFREALVAAIANAQKIHAVCEILAKTTAEWFGINLDASVIYTTVPIPSVLFSREKLRNAESIHFLSSGRLMWCKGFDNLLLALYELRRKGLDVRLTLIGSGPDLDYLLYLRKVLGLEELVHMPGKLAYDQIQDLFKHTHAYIQSSVAEGLSNSLVEAMVNGLPVFATDVGGTREVIEDGVTGFLLSPFEPQTWVEKLSLVRDETLMEQIRQRAYQKARDLFSADRHAREFADFYKKALS